MKNKTIIPFLFFLLLIFSGCTFFSQKEKISQLEYIELEGTVVSEKESQFSLSDYFLVNDQNKKIAHLKSQLEDLDTFLNTKVIMKGERITNNNVKNKNNILNINVVQIAKLPSTFKKIFSKYLGVSITLPNNFFSEEENKRFHIIKKSNNEKFFTISWQKNEGWQNRFLTQGEKIIIKDFDVRRIYAGKRIQLFFPKYEIQVDFWGTQNGEYTFYEILETIEFLKKENHYENNDDTPSSQVSSLEIPRKNDTYTTKIIDLIEKEITKQKNSSSQEKSIKKIALYKNFADVEFFFDKKKEKKRVVFKIIKEEDKKNLNFRLEEVARYKEGEIRSWELESGTTPKLAGESEIFLIDISDFNPIILQENFALYVSTHFDFQVGYPKKMYFKASSKNNTDNFIAKVEWSKEPVNSYNVEIRLEILNGKVIEEKISDQENTIIFPRDEKTHFKFSALADNMEVVKEMKKTFRME